MSFRTFSRAVGLIAGLAAAGAAHGQEPNLKALHDALHLSADQEAAWSDYKSAATPTPQAQQRRRAAARLFPTLTAPRRIDLVEAEMQEDLADLHRQGEALKRFYARLSPAQQRTFDAQTLPPPQSRDSERN
jgi:hypothetical protein